MFLALTSMILGAVALFLVKEKRLVLNIQTFKHMWYPVALSHLLRIRLMRHSMQWMHGESKNTGAHNWRDVTVGSAGII